MPPDPRVFASRISSRMAFGRATRLAMALLLGIAGTPLGCFPPIDWDPDLLELELAPGTSRSVAVSFLPSADLGDVELRVVPELAPYVTTEPEGFSALRAGEEHTLTVTVAIPADALPGMTLDGVIQVRSASRPPRTHSRPLPVEITVTESADIASLIAELEESGLIPKLDRSADIAGPDVDQNEIRDDVDAFIATLPIDAGQGAAAEQLARHVQAALLVDVTDTAALQDADQRGVEAVRCLFLRLPDDGAASAVVGAIEAFTANTALRAERYIAFNEALDGTVNRLPSADTCTD